MNGKRNWMTGALLGVALAAFSALPTLAFSQTDVPVLGHNTGQVIHAGFTDLPLRECQGTYAGIITKMPHGQPMNVWWDNGDGWAYVEMNGKFGWVCIANTY